MACFGLFLFELDRFALLFKSALVGRELRGALMICVGSLVGRSLMIRDRELVF